MVNSYLNLQNGNSIIDFENRIKFLEFESKEEFENFISDKNVLAFALSDLNIHLIAVIKDGRHVVYAIRELSS